MARRTMRQRQAMRDWGKEEKYEKTQKETLQPFAAFLFIGKWALNKESQSRASTL